MFSSVKFSTELFVLCFVLVTSAVYAIELPKDRKAKPSVRLPNTIIVEAESAAQMDKGVEIVKNKDASEGVAINSVREAKAVHEIDIPKPGKSSPTPSAYGGLYGFAFTVLIQARIRIGLASKAQNPTHGTPLEAKERSRYIQKQVIQSTIRRFAVGEASEHCRTAF